MDCNDFVLTNTCGTPYLSTTGTTVGDDTVDFSLGFRRRAIPPVGHLLVRITSAIPAGTTGTLPVTLTLNGVTRQLKNMDGTNVIAADLPTTGVLFVFNDKYNGVLQLMSSL